MLLSQDHTYNERYRVVARLGSGSQGEVYRVWDAVERRHKAIKLPTVTRGRKLTAHNWRNWTTGERADVLQDLAIGLRHELVGGRVRSPYVCDVYGIAEDVFELTRFKPRCAPPVLMMEDLGDARPMDESLRARDRAESLELLACVAEGLAACHEMRPAITHRDLSPDNVLLIERVGLSGEGLPPSPVIIDFGGARAGSEGGHQTVWLGKAQYSPPESVSVQDGSVVVRPSWDVWSLGVLIYWELTGHLPLDHDVTALRGKITPNSVNARSERISQAALPLLGVPPGIQGLLRRALAFRPEDRPTARQMMEALRAEKTAMAMGLVDRENAIAAREVDLDEQQALVDEAEAAVQAAQVRIGAERAELTALRARIEPLHGEAAAAQQAARHYEEEAAAKLERAHALDRELQHQHAELAERAREVEAQHERVRASLPEQHLAQLHAAMRGIDDALGETPGWRAVLAGEAVARPSAGGGRVSLALIALSGACAVLGALFGAWIGAHAIASTAADTGVVAAPVPAAVATNRAPVGVVANTITNVQTDASAPPPQAGRGSSATPGPAPTPVKAGTRSAGRPGDRPPKTSICSKLTLLVSPPGATAQVEQDLAPPTGCARGAEVDGKQPFVCRPPATGKFRVRIKAPTGYDSQMLWLDSAADLKRTHPRCHMDTALKFELE